MILTENIEKLGEKFASVLSYPPQIPHGLEGFDPDPLRRITALTMARPLKKCNVRGKKRTCSTIRLEGIKIITKGRD
jgi:hypothetical protein